MDTSNEQRERDKSRRGDRPSRFSDGIKDRSRERRVRENRIYITNIPYEYRWTDVKDLFKKHVGDVGFVELFNDENGRPRGCGIVEFSNPESVKKAMEVMHRHSLGGRKLIIKEDFGNERDKLGYVIKGNRDDNDRPNNARNNRGENWGGTSNNPLGVGINNGDRFNTYGLSTQFLDSIGIQGPLLNKVFVANLDYKVDKAKLKEVFKMAGKVKFIDLSTDKEGNSRGFAVIEYDHPVEAVQAISMFDKQILFERTLTVRMDRVSSDKAEIRLPEGLKSIGLGLGLHGEPLYDVTRHLTQNTLGGIGLGISGQSGIGAGILGAVPSAGLGIGNINGSGIGYSATGSSLGGSIGLQDLGLSNLNSYQSQILQQGMMTNDIGLGNTSRHGGSNLGIPGGMQGLDSTSRIQNGLGNGNMGGFGRSDGMSQNLSNFPSQLNLSRPPNNNNLFGGQQGMNSMMPSPHNNMFGNNHPNDELQGNNQEKISDTVQINNLPSSITWQLLREKFGEAGEVKFADKTGKNTGLIRFQNEWSASRAIEMFDRTRIDGRTIDVMFY